MDMASLLQSLPEQWVLIFIALVSVMCLRAWKRSQAGRPSSSHQAQRRCLSWATCTSSAGCRTGRCETLPGSTVRVMQLRLGTAPTVVLSSAAAAWAALKEHDLDCCTRPVSPGPKLLTYGLKNVAFAPFGAYWRDIRKLLVVELLSARRVKAAWFARQEQVDKLMSTLRAAGTQPVALDGHILRLADGIIGTVAFGQIYGSSMFSESKNFQHALDEAAEVLSSSSAEDFFPKAVGRLIDRVTGVVARRQRIFEQLDGFFEMVIDHHLDPKRATPDAGGDLVDVLIAHWKDGRNGFTRDHVKAILFDTFIAGIDTSSVTITWAMSELMRCPRVLRKAQDEVRAVVGGEGRVQPEHVSKLSYMRMVVKETLRLHPPATMLVPRETIRDIQVGGYDVPAKTRIYVNAWAIGRDPANWPDDPEEFNPDRFEASDIDLKGEHPQLLPFGTGRRICPGISMGLATVEFTLANLLCYFQWALPEGMLPEDVSMEEQGKINFHRKTPLLLVPTGIPLPITPRYGTLL